MKGRQEMEKSSCVRQIEILFEDGSVNRARYFVEEGKKYGIRIELDHAASGKTEVAALEDFFDQREDALSFLKILVETETTIIDFEDIKLDLYTGLVFG